MFVHKLRNASFALASALAVALPSSSQAATMVDLELALLIDVSGSVNATEYNLQRQGYVNAFNSAAVQNAILAGALGKIAATVVLWSGAGQQSQALGWTEINSAASASAFATSIGGLGRTFSGNTAPGSAINYIFNSTTGSTSFSENMFTGTRNVIDVSGDGTENSGLNTKAARDAALAGGIDAINGIAIGGGSSVNSFYQNNIVGGTNSFFLTASNFSTFGDAVQRKLVAEITNKPPVVPLPAAGWMLIAGLGGLAAMKRRKTKAAA